MTTNYTKQLTGAELEAYKAERFPTHAEAQAVADALNSKPQPSCRATESTTNQGFFYVDGIPTKGAWIDLDIVGAWEDIQDELSKLYPSSDFEEVLCADIEGLPKFFYASSCDGFDLAGWLEFLEDKLGSHLEDQIIYSYFDNCGVSPVSDVEEAYAGEYENWEDFAYQFAEDTGMLSSMEESLKCYFDYGRFGNDLSYDYFESNGYYFRNI